MKEMTLDSASLARAAELDVKTIEKNPDTEAQEVEVNKEWSSEYGVNSNVASSSKETLTV